MQHSIKYKLIWFKYMHLFTNLKASTFHICVYIRFKVKPFYEYVMYVK